MCDPKHFVPNFQPQNKPQFINSPEDMEWLLDVHCKDLKISWEPRSAIIYGNEDCPDKIDLFPARDSLITDIPLTGIPCDEQYIFCGPLDFETAMGIDTIEKLRESL